MNKEKALSICMIVKNEAMRLERCLKSVCDVAEEIVVVDTGSTDGTVEIARRVGAVIVESPWRNDFSFARNVSIEHATGKWIVWLDADDVVPPASLPLLQDLKQRPADCVYSFIVRNERPGNTGTEFTQARMFPNRSELRFERRIHEQIMPSALRIGLQLCPSGVVVEHHGYADPETLRKKAERNVNMLIEEYPLVAPDAVTAVEIADSFLLIGNDDKAFQWYRNVLDIYDSGSATPTIAGHANHGLGTIYSRRNCFTKAIEHFNRALELSPWRPDTLYGLAVAQELSGDPEAAIETLGKIPEMKHEVNQVGVDFRLATVKAFLRIIRLLCELGKYNEAKVWVEKAIRNRGDRPEIFIAAGKFYLKTGALIDALHAFEKSLMLRPRNIDAYIGLCLIYRTAGKNEKLMETLDAIHPLFTGNERYLAFRRFILGKESHCPSVEISDEKYERQLNILKRDFLDLL